MMPKIYQHITDPPIYMTGNHYLHGLHIIRGGTSIGRVLFTEHSPMIEVTGYNNLMIDCELESLTSEGTAVEVA